MTGLVRLLALGFLALQIGGCATVINGTSQDVNIDTPNAAKAECTLSNRSMEQPLTVVTPATVRVPRSGGDLGVTCEREGYHPASGRIGSLFTGTTVGNVLIGGLIGVAVDATSGANNRYPRDIEIYLTRLGETEPDPLPGPVEEERVGNVASIVGYPAGDSRNGVAWKHEVVAAPAPGERRPAEPDAESLRRAVLLNEDGVAVLRAERDQALADAEAWDQKANAVIRSSTGSTNGSVSTENGGKKLTDRWLDALSEAAEARRRAAELDATIEALEAQKAKSKT